MGILYYTNTYAQTPRDDANWTLDTDWSDEFNTFDIHKWGIGYEWGNYLPWQDNTGWDMVRVEDGYLILSAKWEPKVSVYGRQQVFDENLNPPVLKSSYFLEAMRTARQDPKYDRSKNTYDLWTYFKSGVVYSTGYIQSGFIEVSMKPVSGEDLLGFDLGDFPNGYGQTAEGIHADFWGFNQDMSHTPASIPWAEIDVFETNVNHNYHTSCVHTSSMNTSLTNEQRHVSSYQYYNNDNANMGWTKAGKATINKDFQYLHNTNFHLFSTEWQKDYINIYHNDKLVNTTNYYYPSLGYDFYDMMPPMRFIFDLNLPCLANGTNAPSITCEDFSANTMLPFDLQIDYIRRYTLIDHTNVDYVFSNNPNYGNYSYGVKKSITVGGTNYSCPMGNSAKMAFRATESILLDEGFEVPVGAEFYANVHGLEN